MFKKIFFAIVFQGGAMLFAQEGVLKIELSDKMSGEALEAANVVVESGGVLVGKGITDAAGNLVFKNLSPGEYNVKAIYTGYSKNMITGVLVKNNETTYLDIKLSSENVIDEFVVIEYKKPLIDPNTSIKTTFTFEEIQRSPLDPFSLISSGAVQQKEGISPSYRGARPTSNVYIIDGQVVSTGSLGIPRSAIEQMSVTLGGVPAKYGDGTGAFIEIETRSGLVNSNDTRR